MLADVDEPEEDDVSEVADALDADDPSVQAGRTESENSNAIESKTDDNLVN